jgi:hypothetical protein
MTREEQDAILVDLWGKDTNCKVIAAAIGKTKAAVVARAHKLNLPRRKTGPRPYAYPELRALKLGDKVHMPKMTAEEANRWRTAQHPIRIRILVKKARESTGYVVERIE